MKPWNRIYLHSSQFINKIIKYIIPCLIARVKYNVTNQSTFNGQLFQLCIETPIGPGTTMMPLIIVVTISLFKQVYLFVPVVWYCLDSLRKR